MADVTRYCIYDQGLRRVYTSHPTPAFFLSCTLFCYLYPYSDTRARVFWHVFVLLQSPIIKFLFVYEKERTDSVYLILYDASSGSLPDVKFHHRRPLFL